ncbi:hypothetical protein PCC7424_0733 [Gloeothece citriformis PCC 7424]|uniref:Uncharacterized protein n=1 Tax=Gloeothece citriformis (strain PCC 7424) TaxID=65393 RepID=B7KFZ6_GLOC7|nr:hypothetical protein [Gloeothece citriformis]ACK69189.1 hypothetical protein PCC7424_0733 [Gloeothece citriformis PCC 7424]
MSSSPTKPYKSKLLNLINRQSLRLKEQLNRTGRHLKIAVDIGVQILVYPLYLLVQTGRMSQRQLKQKIQQPQVLPPESSSQVQPITCNQPIENILESLESWLSQGHDNIDPSRISPALEPISSPFSTRKKLVVRGLATLIKNQNLVLVSSDNLLIDVFSPPQQKQLKKLLSWELANYQYQRRFQERTAKKFPSLIPAFQFNNPHVVPPVRWFWTVMRWIQTSQVAIAINLFGESTFIRRPRPSFPQIPPAQEVTESPNYTHTKRIDDNTSNVNKIYQLIEAAIDYFLRTVKGTALENKVPYFLTSSTAFKKFSQLGVIGRKTPQSIQLIIQKDSPKTLKNNSNYPLENSEPFQIQVLIQAAIDYFFGLNKNLLLLTGNKSSLKAKLSPKTTQPLTQGTEPDPWLTWDDLFSQENPQKNENKQKDIPVESLPKLPSSQIPEQPKNSLQIPLITKTNEESSSPLVLNKRIQPNISQSQKDELMTNQPSATIQSISESNNPLIATPEWIETEATPIGYVKHPLVKIIELLDVIIYWFEKLWVKFWHWLKKGNQ